MKTRVLWHLAATMFGIMAAGLITTVQAAPPQDNPYEDDMYETHDRKAIAEEEQRVATITAARAQAAAEAARAVHESKSNEGGVFLRNTGDPYKDVVGEIDTAALASTSSRRLGTSRSLRGQSNETSYYNVAVQGDNVIVEPKYAASFYGDWDQPSVNVSLGFGFASPYWGVSWGWGPSYWDPFYWGSSWYWGSPYWGSSYWWAWNRPYWGWGGWYDPWYPHWGWGPSWGPGWGHGWGPGWGPSHPYKPNHVTYRPSYGTYTAGNRNSSGGVYRAPNTTISGRRPTSSVTYRNMNRTNTTSNRVSVGTRTESNRNNSVNTYRRSTGSVSVGTNSGSFNRSSSPSSGFRSGTVNSSPSVTRGSTPTGTYRRR